MKITVAETKRALYFGCRGSNELGHYLQERDKTIWSPPSGLPWNLGHLDGGLLKNGQHRDLEDGRVFWTCGGEPLWFAFFWWDNSGDSRQGSNSGFYVQGFSYQGDAFAYACSVYPDVITRQHQPLVLQA